MGLRFKVATMCGDGHSERPRSAESNSSSAEVVKSPGAKLVIAPKQV